MRPGTYGDFSEMGDYMENMNKIVQAREMFDALPSRVRERFGNNPGAMIDFVMDPNNKEEAKKLGLLKEDVSISEVTKVTEVTEQTSTTEVS